MARTFRATVRVVKRVLTTGVLTVEASIGCMRVVRDIEFKDMPECMVRYFHAVKDIKNIPLFEANASVCVGTNGANVELFDWEVKRES